MRPRRDWWFGLWDARFGWGMLPMFHAVANVIHDTNNGQTFGYSLAYQGTTCVAVILVFWLSFAIADLITRAYRQWRAGAEAMKREQE